MKRQRTHWNQTQTDEDMIGNLELSHQESDITVINMLRDLFGGNGQHVRTDNVSREIKAKGKNLKEVLQIKSL